MGETRVDLLHLLEDLRDAYPGALEETILTEIVANALDSGARHVALVTDAAGSTFRAVDDGSGMARRELARYHDVAASTKARGDGIGFAGVGIKLGLLICSEVVTETRRGSSHVATRWGLASRHKAPWRWVPPQGIVAERGTAVLLCVKNPLSPLLDPGYVEAVIRRHFAPLLDGTFAEVLEDHYPGGVTILVDGQPLSRDGGSMSRVPIAIRMGRKRKPSAVGYIERFPGPLPEDRQGIAVSTLGKVIKRGWDWLAIPAAAADRITGLVEVPALAGALTLNKADFIRTGQRGVTYLVFRKAIQEAVSTQLGVWGETVDQHAAARRRRARPLERDLEGVLTDLAEQFPLVATLVGRRSGGQRRLPMGRAGAGDGHVLETYTSTLETKDDDDATTEEEDTRGAGDTAAADPTPSEDNGHAPPTGDAPATGHAAAEVRGRPERKRPGRYGLALAFESRPDDPELGRLSESTVWVNDGHPAYRRAAASRSEGYHIALTVGITLSSLAAEPTQTREFLTTFLARWGQAIDRPVSRGGSRGPRRASRERPLPLQMAGEPEEVDRPTPEAGDPAPGTE